jgi:alpha-mannosidase
MKLPRALKEDRRSRSDERVDCPTQVYVSMYDRIPRIDVKTIFDNRAKDHRLRVCFPTRLQTEYSHADDHFYVVKRPSRTPPGEDWIEQPSNTHPQSRFVDVSDGSVGVAIANKGLPEYELKNDEDATIALTLLRCVGWLSRGDLSTRIGEAGPMIATPKAQCQGSHTFEYSIVPHAGDWVSGKVYKQALEFDVGSLANMVEPHEGDLPPTFRFLKIEPDHLVVSSVKKAEDENALAIRFYNVTGRSVKGKLQITKSERLRDVWTASISEERKRKLKEAVNEVFEIPVEPHKVISILAGTF